MLGRRLVGVCGATVAGAYVYRSWSEVLEARCEGSSLERRNSVTDGIKAKARTPSVHGIPSREHQVQALQSGADFDVLVIGGGATGCGVALDAATRGLKTACVERGDFASETSSRSSKLLWGGSKYIATAVSQLFSWKSLTQPISAIGAFYSEMKMVLHCHKERTYMMETHPHLVNWVPIAIPFKSWIMWEPVLDHPLFMILPLIAPIFTKFYDSLSGFHCPSSYVLGPRKAKETFPQLQDEVKYCAVLHEGQHNDARTCTSIALTAALKGATIANHVEVVEVIHGGPEGASATGVRCVDRLSGRKFVLKAKAIIFAGGPYTDSLRRLEEPECKPAVGAGAGCHIVLPGYYSPQSMGLADMRTSRGAFLFFLPWKGSTVVGTTDRKSPAQTSPGVEEDEIQYLLNEVSRYLTPDLQVRRSDVLSAWRGWRPLAKDPHAPPGAPVSRDHLISTNPSTGITFVTGGKWTTYREMAEHTIDRIVSSKRLAHAGPCVTKSVPLIGSESFQRNLNIKLTQKYGLNSDVADHLVSAYGMRASDVCELSKPTGKRWPRFGVPLVEGYPFIEAEISYAVKEYARTIKDVLSLRMASRRERAARRPPPAPAPPRLQPHQPCPSPHPPQRLAFLNSEAAKELIPAVADIMGRELGWSSRERNRQIAEATSYISQFGGPVPDKSGAMLRSATFADLKALFNELDADGSGYLDELEIGQAASRLGFPFKSRKELRDAFDKLDKDKNGRISLDEFVEWWNVADQRDGLWSQLHSKINVTPDWEG